MTLYSGPDVTFQTATVSGTACPIGRSLYAPYRVT